MHAAHEEYWKLLGETVVRIEGNGIQEPAQAYARFARNIQVRRESLEVVGAYLHSRPVPLYALFHLFHLSSKVP